MTLQEMYKTAIELGIKADPRSPADIKDALKDRKEEFKKLATGLEKNAEEIKEVLNEGAVWWREFANDTRVFCVTEIHDDLLMWAHYADNHGLS